MQGNAILYIDSFHTYYTLYLITKKTFIHSPKEFLCKSLHFWKALDNILLGSGSLTVQLLYIYSTVHCPLPNVLF